MAIICGARLEPEITVVGIDIFLCTRSYSQQHKSIDRVFKNTNQIQKVDRKDHIETT